MDEKQDFSKRLEQALRDAGVNTTSPARLALEFNLHHWGVAVTPQSVRKWMSGKAIPTEDKILTFAEWLNVSSEWLRFGDTRGKDRQPKQPRTSRQAVDLRLHGDLQRLSQEHKIVVQEIITTLLRLERGKE